MPNQTITSFLQRSGLLAILCAGFLIAGCDSTAAVDDPTGDPVTIQGRATDDDGYGKQAANVEGATVTAASIRANGSLQQHDVEATTDAQGAFSIEVEPASDVVLLRAEKDDGYSARTLVRVDGAGTVRAMPMTTESTTEADVYVRARESGNDRVTPSSVAAHVNASAAADVDAGNTSLSALASAVSAAVEAESRFISQHDEYGNDELSAKAAAEADAFITLQNQLYNAADGSVERAALTGFYEAMVDAWTDAGIDLATQAKARAAALAAFTHLGSDLEPTARREVRRQVLRMAGLATALAVEATFEAEGSSQQVLSSLAEARATLIADLEAAGSTNALAESADAYRASVLTELSAEADLSESAIGDAMASLDTPFTTLYSALLGASSPQAVATAYVAYDAAATAALLSHFDDHAHAELATAVLLLISL